MYIEVTLYKSGFTPEDVFVGTSPAARSQALQTLPTLKLRRSAFNPQTPFRLAGNFLQYDRVYDYVQYDFFETLDAVTPTQTRFYFVDAFVYVNDNITDIRVMPDLVGELWYQLKFDRYLPDRFTYKKSVVGSNFEKQNFGDVFVANRYKDFRKRLGDSSLYLGFVVVTVLTNSDAGYTESGQKMPCENVLLPFLYDDITKEIEQQPRAICTNISPTMPYKYILSIDELISLYRVTVPGFKVVSSFIFLETDNFVDELRGTKYSQDLIPKLEEYEFTINGDYLLAGGAGLDTKQYGVFEGKNVYYLVSQWLTGATTNTFEIPVTNEHFTQYAPYTTYSIEFNGKTIEFDSAWFEEFIKTKPSGTPLKVCFEFSFLPPYNYTFYVVDDIVTKSVPKMVAVFSNNTNVMEYNERYAEWLQTNYNSAITGLQVRQNAQREQFTVGTVWSFVGALGGAAKGAMRGGIAGAITSGISSVFDAGVSAAVGYEKLKINQATERKMLDLRIQDLKNAPDYASFNGSIASYIKAKNYCFINKNENVFNAEIEKYYTAFGVGSSLPATFPSHTRFDYVRGDDYILAPDSVKLTFDEQAALRENLRAGVRLWYTLDGFKNVDENPEVTA